MLVNTKSWPVAHQCDAMFGALDYLPIVRNLRATMLYYLVGELSVRYFRNINNPFWVAFFTNPTTLIVAHPYNITDKLLRGADHLC